MVEEVIYQEHTYEITKDQNVGFGIAISGGRDNPGVQSNDPAIIISDVVRHGPAFSKLEINDTVVRVNNKPTYGMTHQQAVKELKNSGRRVVISIKRKAVVRVESRRTPSPGQMRRSHSRDLDDLHRSGRGRRRGSRDWSPKRHRSRSRGSAYHRSRSRGRATSRSRSRSRGRSYSRSRSRSSRRSRGYRTPSSSSRSPSPPPRRSRSPDRRSRSPDRRSRRDSRERSRSRGRRSVSRGRSSRSSSRSVTPPRTLQKQKSVGELRSLSPLSPDPPGSKPDGDVMVFPVKPSEMRPVVLKKTRWNNSYGLKLGTRIFIQDIQPGSLADKNPELKRGDTIMMINGRNVDNKTVQEAIQIIGLSKDKLTMLVKSEDGGTVSIPASQLTPPTPKEKEKPKEKAPVEDNASSYSHRSSPSRASTRSEASRKSDKKHEKKTEPKREPEPEKKPEKKAIGGVRVMPAELSAAAMKEKTKQNYPESTSSRSSSQPSHTPEPAPRAKAVQPVQNQPLYDVPPSDEEEAVLPHDAHTVTFVKGRNVGIRLAGGNDVGIFVASVLEGSPAARQGLKMGDQILSVNDQNFRNIIREEAVLALMGLPDGQEVSIVAQPKPDVYQKILEHGTGDSFYIRTHFKYERANEHEMSFKQGSVFRISDTLYQGMVGYWLAVRIGRSNMEIERGVIPNGSRAQQLKEVQDKKVLQSKEKSQRGGIKRRLKGNQGKGKPEKPATTTTGPSFPAYERVVLREAGFKRPVVIFGPLADIARQRLASDYPPNYEVAGNDGIISGQKSNRKGIIRLNTIKDIIEKDKHAILDITPTAVEKLNYAQLYPIVVFLKPTSKAAVKELRSKLAVTEEEKKKKPGKLYDRAVKMQKGYGHVCTDTIPLGTVSDDWYRKLHSTIKDQQNMPVWVSEDKLGGTAEEDSEGMVVPGDDDRLSYVSAPASDYSVTTVGSEMLHSTTDLDDEDLEDHRDQPGHRAPPVGGVALLPPIKRPPSSTSSSEDEDAGGRFGDDDLDDALKEDLDEEPPATKPLPPSSTRENAVVSPPRIAAQPAAKADDTSSTSSEEHRPPPVRAPAPVTTTPAKTAEPTRGHQSMPEGRFDPDSFLKNHIKRLNKVRSEDAAPPAPRNEPSMSPRHVEPPRHVDPPQPVPPSVVPKRAPEVESTRYQPPSQPQSYGTRRDTPNAEPVYAQVDKSRRPPMHSEPQPQPQPQAQPQRPPGGYGDSAYRKPPENTYNRFAGSSSFPPKTNQPPRSNAYKGYTPRPYNKVSGPMGPSRIENGPSKDHMYDSGVDTHEKPKIVQPDHHAPEPLPSDGEDPQVVATARGVFDHDGGVLSSVETGVSIMIPKGAIPPGVRQEIYFKVCKDNTVLPPLDKDKGETLLSPLVMCGPHGLQFNHPVELRLPHCEPSQWQNMNMNSDSGYQVSSNSVSVLIDHF